MAQIRETDALPMGKGCRMVFKVDDSQPKDSASHNWTETSYDGQPDSWCPEIGSHWHAHHSETMQVLSGVVTFTLNSTTTTLTPSSPPLLIPPYHVHNFRFHAGVPTLLKESTDPAGKFKEKFFRDLLDSEDGQPRFFNVMRAFYDGDCFLAMPGGWRGVDVGVTWVLGVVARWWRPFKGTDGMKGEGEKVVSREEVE